MRHHTLSGIDKQCSVIGFGAWGIGGATPGATSYGDISDQDALDCIQQAYVSGMRFFDTSPAYGYGRSEERLGHVLKGHREQVIIATKGGMARYDEPPNFSVTALTKGLTDSLTRLDTDYVDLFQLHNPPTDLFSQASNLTTFLDALKATRKTTAVGISVKSPAEAIALLDHYPFDAVQVNLNMLDMRAVETGLLDICQEKGVSVLARTPLCFGFLSLTIDETTVFNNADHRAHWSVEQKALWANGARQAQIIAAKHDPANTSAAARALRFCLLHPSVKTVLTGPMTTREAIENAKAGAMPPLATHCQNDMIELNKNQSFIIK